MSGPSAIGHVNRKNARQRAILVPVDRTGLSSSPSRSSQLAVGSSLETWETDWLPQKGLGSFDHRNPILKYVQFHSTIKESRLPWELDCIGKDTLVLCENRPFRLMSGDPDWPFSSWGQAWSSGKHYSNLQQACEQLVASASQHGGVSLAIPTAACCDTL